MQPKPSANNDDANAHFNLALPPSPPPLLSLSLSATHAHTHLLAQQRLNYNKYVSTFSELIAIVVRWMLWPVGAFAKKPMFILGELKSVC